jgi:hypothetical protein
MAMWQLCLAIALLVAAVAAGAEASPQKAKQQSLRMASSEVRARLAMRRLCGVPYAREPGSRGQARRGAQVKLSAVPPERRPACTVAVAY